MRIVEASGRTIDEAVRDALERLGAGRDDVDIEIVEEGSKGLFGLLGGRRARVRVQLKAGVQLADARAKAEEVATAATAETAASPAAVDTAPPAGQAVEHVHSAPSTDEEQIIEQKREFALEFVAGVLERLEVEAALETRLDEDGISHIHVVGDELGLVIGRRGQTLDALQFLVNQAANKDGGPRARIVLDAGGYRERRAETLAALAGRMADRAARQGRNVALEPMNAYERRIVHMSLADDETVETYSEGEDPHRRIIIAPRRA